jgi:hypothetical protein
MKDTMLFTLSLALLLKTIMVFVAINVRTISVFIPWVVTCVKHDLSIFTGRNNFPTNIHSFERLSELSFIGENAVVKRGSLHQLFR